MNEAQLFSLDGYNKVQQVLANLKFVSKIQNGEKINAQEMFVRNNDSIWQRMLRTIRNATNAISMSNNIESKDSTLLYIQNTINDAITLISVYRQVPDDEFKNNIADIIVENLENSKIGIRNMISTYQYDRKFISDAEAVIQTLEARIKSLESKGYIKGLTNSSFLPENSLSIYTSK